MPTTKTKKGKSKAEQRALSDDSRQLYKLEFDSKDWEEIINLGFEPFEIFEDEELTRGQWMAIAEMCLGKSVRIKRGDYNMGDGQNTRINKEWREQLENISAEILSFFQPGDGKL